MTVFNKAAFILMCMIAIVATMAYGTVHQPIIAFFYLSVGLLVMLVAADSFRSGVVRYGTSLLQLPVYATALYALFQVIPFGESLPIAGIDGISRTISFDPFSTKVTALHFFAIGLFFSCSLIIVDSAKRIQRLTTTLIIFGFGYAFFSIIQSVLSPQKIYGLYDALSPFGTFVNRHNFAAAMEMLIALPLGMLFAGAIRPDKRLLYVTAVVLMGAALLLSGSRGGLVSFVAMLTFLVFVTSRSRGKKRVALRGAMAVLLLLIVVGGAVFVGGDTSLTRITDSAASKDVTTGRFDIWTATLKMIADDLPFGAGLGAYAVAYSRFDTGSGLERVEQAHNDYLQVTSDAGIPGLIIGGFFLFFLFKAGKRGLAANNLIRRGIATGAIAGIFAILVHSIFDFVLHTTAVAVIFMLLMTLLAATGAEYEDDIIDLPDDGRRRDHPQKRKIKR